MTFYLGTHEVGWLALTDVPLFVSRVRLRRRKSLPRAAGRWALDSGGFSELDAAGRWSVTAAEYAREVRRYRDEIGGLEWAAAMDWMCEPRVRAATGLAVADHQRRTVDNYLELLALAPEVPWVPVLQGWGVAEYWRHADEYARAGVDLAALPRVGVGSVCRRQAVTSGGTIFATLAAAGLKLHGFGVKLTGLALSAGHLASADSLAWSFSATKNPPLPGCPHRHCNNCLRYALDWRAAVAARLPA